MLMTGEVAYAAMYSQVLQSLLSTCGVVSLHHVVDGPRVLGSVTKPSCPSCLSSRRMFSPVCNLSARVSVKSMSGGRFSSMLWRQAGHNRVLTVERCGTSAAAAYGGIGLPFLADANALLCHDVLQRTQLPRYGMN